MHIIVLKFGMVYVIILTNDKDMNNSSEVHRHTNRHVYNFVGTYGFVGV